MELILSICSLKIKCILSRGQSGSAGHSTGRSALDEMAAYELHHPGDILYRDNGSVKYLGFLP